MSEKASVFSGNAVWVAGVVVALGVSVYALLASGVLEGGSETDEAAATEQPTSAALGAASTQESSSDTAGVAVEKPVQGEDLEEASVIAPSFDVVRVDAEGNTVVAGHAAPNASLAILLDGEEIALAPVDIDGKFAAILSIDPSEKPRVLSLAERGEDGDVLSGATVIVAPVLSVAQGAEAQAIAGVASDVPRAGQVQNDAEVAVVAEKESTPSTEDAQGTSGSEPLAATVSKAPAVIISDAEGVRVVQPAAPEEAVEEVLAAVTIDSISYTDTGAVMVSGRGNPSNFVRLYLDNDFVAQATIGDAGLWSRQLADVAGGLYELRVDELDPEGKVTSRVATPFKRETPETVARARAQSEAPAPSEAGETVVTETASAAVQTEVAETQKAVEEIAKASPDTAAGADITSTGANTSGDDDTTVAVAVAEEISQAAVTDDVKPQTEVGQASQEPVTVEVGAAQDIAPAGEVAADATVAEEKPAEIAPVTTQPAAVPAVEIVTVQPGSTLWAIARDQYGEGLLYLRVFEANKDKIRDPDLIYPGQVFTVPE
ncbi:LysM peptidoglycan-binding domain-containing protein [Shimia marina]|uniref:LysM domain/BON superfamily protein n=1 Tax=Shimia marina TaxID=321267 RepID=A0A0N7LRW8_9RHOB|nr:LysM peptidoglycan-binding domain-containing protein [Shimia marina]CUH51980.1 LysM domain/BON superfamily protein [Shimia marina]SFE78111.1 LysM domain-containing protein [Shimia marina]